MIVGSQFKAAAALWAKTPLRGKLLALAIAANEVRGTVMAAAGLGDLGAHGWAPQTYHYVLTAALLLVMVMGAVWREARRRRRIARRFAAVLAAPSRPLAGPQAWITPVRRPTQVPNQAWAPRTQAAAAPV